MAQYTEIDLNAMNSSSQSEETGNETQLATAYIAYMMVGSFFNNCRIQSQLRVNSLRVHYSEMRVNSQLSVERRMERDFEEQFAPYLDAFEVSQCMVIVRDRDDGVCVEFDTGLEKIDVIVDKEGQYSFQLHH